jgi:hypothetical protein
MELPNERRDFRRIMEMTQPLNHVSLMDIGNCKDIEVKGNLQASYSKHDGHPDLPLHAHVYLGQNG